MSHPASELVPFLSAQPFIAENREPIAALFGDLRRDFPEAVVELDGVTYSTGEALQIGEDDELSAAARRWLFVKTQGIQHGYDRGVGDKVYIPHLDPHYMERLGQISYAGYNFVRGGAAEGGVEDTNILVACGFPRLNASRLRYSVQDDYEQLHGAHSIAMLTGQRRRWEDNKNEDTPATVISQTAVHAGLDLHELRDRALVERWQDASPFARQQRSLGEVDAWHRPYATETELARVALELALVRTDLLDLKEYPVQAIAAPEEASLPYPDGTVPARTTLAWQYQLKNGKTAWVVNAKAQPRNSPQGEPQEPRPSGESVAYESYDLLRDSWRTHANVVAAGAPHIRLAVDTMLPLLVASHGNIGAMRISAGPWESHEPPVTGIASIVSTYKSDKRLRRWLAGGDPNAANLRAL